MAVITPKASIPTQLRLALGVVSIQIEEGFNPTLLGEVLQVLQADFRQEK
ncbi:hypothetical protein [Sporosarcina sp. NPDC096371]